MILLDLTQVYLLELLKASLFDINPVIPVDANWDEIYSIAKGHCIIPLVASCVPEEHRNKWLEVSYQNKAHYMQMLYEQAFLDRLFKSNGIPYVILKGTAAGIYYPTPTLRTYGDIDIYVSDFSHESARKLLDNNGYLLLARNERHFEYEKNGWDIELHSRFSSDSYNDIEDMLLYGLNNAIEYKIGDFSFPGLPKYENGLVLLGHIYKHFCTSGIGLRQVIDWMMFVHSELDDSAWEHYFRSLAVNAGLEKLAITVTYMCKKWLGLPNLITWCNSADEHVAEQMLIRVLEDGNFNRERASFDIVKRSFNRRGKFKYLQRAGLENWSLSKKYKFLRNFAWLYQLFRYAGQGFVGLFTGKKVFMKNKHDMSIEELLERLE